MQDLDHLIGLLNSVVAIAPQREHFIDPFDPPAWAKSMESQQLIERLSAADTERLFESALQRIGNHAFAVDYYRLLRWMVDRAREVGSQQCVKEVFDYFDCVDFSAHAILFVAGVHCDHVVDMGQGITLAPISLVPTSRMKAIMAHAGDTRMPTPIPSAVLTRPFQQRKRHWSQSKETRTTEPGDWLGGEVLQTLDDARLCLSLSDQELLAIQTIASTMSADDHFPMLEFGVSWGLHSFRAPISFSRRINDANVGVARTLFDQFVALLPEDRTHIRIPMEKIVEAAAVTDWVRSAVELRVALESLLLPDGDKGELRYRLSTRAAILGGGSIEERRDARKRMTKVYDLCSKAVHTGRLPGNNQTGELLRWARQVVRNIICGMLRKQVVRFNWERIELRAPNTIAV